MVVLGDRLADGFAQGRSGNAASAERSSALLGYQLIDSVYFDLDNLRKTIARARQETANQILAFGITSPDSVFLHKMCDWLGWYLGETQFKPPLTLKPEFAPVSDVLRRITQYMPELASANLLCVVDAQEVPAEIVAEFWDGVCHNFVGIDRYLTLIFSGPQDATFPVGITSLPSPQFDKSDIDLWAHEMVRRQGWPMDLANVWTDLLCRESMNNDIINVPGLYAAMDRSIKVALFEPEVFRQRLEEGSRGAHTAHD